MAFTQDVSPIRSEPMKDGKPIARARSGGDWAIGVTLLVFGAIGWLSGARYTLIGWVVGLNLFLAWLGLPITIPQPSGWWMLAMIPIGVWYSRVEMQALSVQGQRGAALARFAIGWLLIVFTDVFSTYLGVRAPAPDAWPITQTIAASAALALVWASILTFVSDWLILGGIKLLKR